MVGRKSEVIQFVKLLEMMYDQTGHNYGDYPRKDTTRSTINHEL